LFLEKKCDNAREIQLQQPPASYRPPRTRRDGELITLQPQVFDLLVYLLENRDRVVSRDDLIALVWGGRLVSDRRSTAGSTPRGTRSATAARNRS
jgi:DNA-binding response OmpR family regulator